MKNWRAKKTPKNKNQATDATQNHGWISKLLCWAKQDRPKGTYPITPFGWNARTGKTNVLDLVWGMFLSVYICQDECIHCQNSMNCTLQICAFHCKFYLHLKKRRESPKGWMCNFLKKWDKQKKNYTLSTRNNLGPSSTWWKAPSAMCRMVCVAPLCWWPKPKPADSKAIENQPARTKTSVQSASEKSSTQGSGYNTSRFWKINHD